LELDLPLLELDVAQLELAGLSVEATGDASALLVIVDRQVDDLCADAERFRDPAERRAFVLVPWLVRFFLAPGRPTMR